MIDDDEPPGFLRVWTEQDAEELAERKRTNIEAEVALLKTMRIGDRVAVTFRSKFDEARGRVIGCEPFSALGEIVVLELHEGRGHVSVLFDGDEIPVGPFVPLDVRLVGSE
jgi:hypothetical protein